MEPTGRLSSSLLSSLTRSRFMPKNRRSGSSCRPDFGAIRGNFQRRFSPKRSPPPPNPDEVCYVILDIASLRVTATLHSRFVIDDISFHNNSFPINCQTFLTIFFELFLGFNRNCNRNLVQEKVCEYSKLAGGHGTTNQINAVLMVAKPPTCHCILSRISHYAARR